MQRELSEKFRRQNTNVCRMVSFTHSLYLCSLSFDGRQHVFTYYGAYTFSENWILRGNFCCLHLELNEKYEINCVDIHCCQQFEVYI